MRILYCLWSSRMSLECVWTLVNQFLLFWIIPTSIQIKYGLTNETTYCQQIIILFKIQHWGFLVLSCLVDSGQGMCNYLLSKWGYNEDSLFECDHLVNTRPIKSFHAASLSYISVNQKGCLPCISFTWSYEFKLITENSIQNRVFSTFWNENR